MFEWLAQNYGTILICIALIGIVILIIAGIRRDKRQGKSTCGANCAHCAMSGQCHRKK